MISDAEIANISAATLPQFMDVWTQNPSATEFGGRFDILAASGIRCRRIDPAIGARSGGQERANFQDPDRLNFQPTYELPTGPCQLEIGGKRFQVIAGSVRERLGPEGEVLVRTCLVMPVLA